ncbi:MAG TPA: S-layer homology domain-containing protein [Candidatus Faecalibacterium faecigallinarum]|uniref:S-layer homology domain-containing protein n=1 Tax=Candidatus Faecalibacterium faecigallinarum TaxID=2838577 RepID=A0A9D2P8Y0_9FIRM|nr:S-layer homology domain-containing protein [Candidatus Faecalibacterium faecigallinarum]
MKKRFLSLLLAVCILIPIFAVPAAAVNSNTAIQTARTMGVLDAATAQSPEALSAQVTRGEFARMLTMVSSYRETVNEQILVGSLFTDVNSDTAYAPYIRIAVQQNWLTGYTDGTFRPNDPVTLEAACASALRLLGFAPSDLSGAFPAAQLNKATELGLRAGLNRGQGEAMTRSDCAVLLYNTLTATTKSGSTYGNTIGLTVSDGQVDTSAILARSLKGPFIAGENETLPINPTTIYRNDEVTDSPALNVNDVYYYSESLNSLWIYTTKASGRIISVSPNAAAPTSVTVAGVTYQIGSTDVAYRISSLSGGGVGQVVTLLLGMEDVAVGILTGEEVDLSYYGVVQSSSRSLTTDNGADVMQTVRVLCTDGTVRSVRVNKNLNVPTGWLVSITSSPEGEKLQSISEKSVSGLFSAANRTLGDYKLANDVEILDTLPDGSAGTVRLDRLDGVTLSNSDVRYYSLNGQGEIDRLVLDDVTGDIWTYGCLMSWSTNKRNSTTDSLTSLQPSDVLMQMASGLLTGSLLNDIWGELTGSTGRWTSLALGLLADNTSGLMSTVLGTIAGGANYTYMNGSSYTTDTTSVLYPVLAGGIGVRHEVNGEVRGMVQLQPILIDSLGPASVTTAGGTRYETADNMQVYLWHMGVYYPTLLPTINADDYFLIGWVDSCTAGHQVRVLTALRKN